jgi:preprotein translocase YajC subunit
MIEEIIAHIVTIIPFLSLAVCYFLLLYFPSKKAGTLPQLHISDKVLTKGGIIGHVAKIEQDFIILELFDGSLVEIQADFIIKKYS